MDVRCLFILSFSGVSVHPTYCILHFVQVIRYTALDEGVPYVIDGAVVGVVRFEGRRRV